jgi:hypothetical protein
VGDPAACQQPAEFPDAAALGGPDVADGVTVVLEIPAHGLDLVHRRAVMLLVANVIHPMPLPAGSDHGGLSSPSVARPAALQVRRSRR